MKYLCLFPLLIIGINFSSKAQYLMERKKLTDVIKFEADQNSENLGFRKMKVSRDFFHGADDKVDYYPLTFKRIKDTFKPQCKVEYYYSTKDSVINAIVYDWNIMDEITNLNVDGKKFEQQVPRKDEYIKQYNAIKAEIIKLLGDPTKSPEISQNTALISGKTDWSLKDKDVTLTLIFTPQLQTVGTFKVGSYRIRLETDWK